MGGDQRRAGGCRRRGTRPPPPGDQPGPHRHHRLPDVRRLQRQPIPGYVVPRHHRVAAAQPPPVPGRPPPAAGGRTPWEAAVRPSRQPGLARPAAGARGRPGVADRADRTGRPGRRGGSGVGFRGRHRPQQPGPPLLARPGVHRGRLRAAGARSGCSRAQSAEGRSPLRPKRNPRGQHPQRSGCGPDRGGPARRLRTYDADHPLRQRPASGALAPPGAGSAAHGGQRRGGRLRPVAQPRSRPRQDAEHREASPLPGGSARRHLPLHRGVDRRPGGLGQLRVRPGDRDAAAAPPGRGSLPRFPAVSRAARRHLLQRSRLPAAQRLGVGGVRGHGADPHAPELGGPLPLRLPGGRRVLGGTPHRGAARLQRHLDGGGRSADVLAAHPGAAGHRTGPQVADRLILRGSGGGHVRGSGAGGQLCGAGLRHRSPRPRRLRGGLASSSPRAGLRAHPRGHRRGGGGPRGSLRGPRVETRDRWVCGLLCHTGAGARPRGSPPDQLHASDPAVRLLGPGPGRRRPARRRDPRDQGPPPPGTPHQRLPDDRRRHLRHPLLRRRVPRSSRPSPCGAGLRGRDSPGDALRLGGGDVAQRMGAHATARQ